MPFYRTPVGMVHMRGTRMPAPCGAQVLIDGRQTLCLVASAFLCDGDDPSHRSGTCDAALCAAHAREILRNRHLCPACHLQHRDADPQRGLFTSIV